MDSSVRSSEKAVLYNQDLLSVICDNLWSAGIQSLPDGATVHPLVSLATVSTSVSETALDRLWRHIYGFNPLLRVLNVGASGPHDGSIWTIPRDVPEPVWNRFKKYAERIRSLTLDASSRAKDHPSIYLRLIAQFPALLFANLKRLEVDQSFAAEPHILFLLSSPDLREVEITLEPNPDDDIVATSVRTAVAGRDTFIISCPLATHAGYNTVPSCIDRACPATFFTVKGLRCLKITSHPVTYSFLEELSSSESLEHLQFVFAPHILPHDDRDGFSSLKILHVTGPIASMSRVLRLIAPDILESFTFIDNSSNQSYHYACEVMLDFHVGLFERFNLSLRELSLTYPYWSISQEHWESSRLVFEPLYGLRLLKTLYYSGNLALDQGTVEKKFATAWKGVENICIPQLAVPLPSDVLLELATHCRQLTCLTIPIAFPDNDALLPRQVLRHRLRVFSSPGIPVGRPASVARYLDSLFPFLAVISGGERWDEVERIILHACQPVRCDERGRDRSKDSD
ncbi:uncharacterized protein EV420DRAFT_874625 [Desarmillaria tabescens]|uniref:F-box domain-containing protein n=1 Tax=Armillaria tabescens TaxID=1929756 RepID=A0AA39JR88_ARMTA|nr:uncharacterized protein EV420DRAFT_874625 [Desarmillaria tabescens]KAK0447427.1 hypothetical protein EV420DRAFT_874625 [Desarmillaria tabescens]